MDSEEVWGCFLMSGVRMLHFLKDWWKFIQIHQNYTMALSFPQDSRMKWSMTDSQNRNAFTYSPFQGRNLNYPIEANFQNCWRVDISRRSIIERGSHESCLWEYLREGFWSCSLPQSLQYEGGRPSWDDICESASSFLTNAPTKIKFKQLFFFLFFPIHRMDGPFS